MSAADSGSDPSPSAVASFKSEGVLEKTDSSALGFLVTIFTVRDPSFRVGLSENFWCAPVLCVKYRYIRVNSCVGGKHAPSVCTLRTDDRRPTTDDGQPTREVDAREATRGKRASGRDGERDGSPGQIGQGHEPAGTEEKEEEEEPDGRFWLANGGTVLTLREERRTRTKTRVARTTTDD